MTDGENKLVAGELEAIFLPRRGMLGASFRHRGEELLRRLENLEAAAAKGSTAGIPLLYPWANHGTASHVIPVPTTSRSSRSESTELCGHATGSTFLWKHGARNFAKNSHELALSLCCVNQACGCG